MWYCTTADRNDSSVKSGHHWGGMAVICAGLLKADETNHRKGSRENPPAKRTARINRKVFSTLRDHVLSSRSLRPASRT